MENDTNSGLPVMRKRAWWLVTVVLLAVNALCFLFSDARLVSDDDANNYLKQNPIILAEVQDVQGWSALDVAHSNYGLYGWQTISSACRGVDRDIGTFKIEVRRLGPFKWIRRSGIELPYGQFIDLSKSSASWFLHHDLSWKSDPEILRRSESNRLKPFSGS